VRKRDADFEPSTPAWCPRAAEGARRDPAAATPVAAISERRSMVIFPSEK
jgi:hypothetical protein